MGYINSPRNVVDVVRGEDGWAGRIAKGEAAHSEAVEVLVGFLIHKSEGVIDPAAPKT